MPQKIILDTDIGDDVDDALALALICASPELELVGVTTVFGNVAARSRQARSILAIAGSRFASIPVASGCGAVLASRTPRDRQEYLIQRLPNQDSTCLPEAELAPADARHGVDFLIDTILQGDGDIVPVAIGPMTNLAMAMVKEPKIVARIPRIVVMAGEFRLNKIEYNVACDPEAAHLVFSSGIPMLVTPWTIGQIAKFGTEHIERLAQCARPMGTHLAKTIAAWQAGGGNMPALFDPHAVATFIDPTLAQWRQGTVHVELQGQRTYGLTTFEASDSGPHRIAWDTDRDASLAFYLERVLAL